VGAHPPFWPLELARVKPVKPVYDPDRPDVRLNLTASTFNQVGQYTSSPGRRGYYYAELAVFFPSGGRNHRQYSLRLPTRDGQAELAWVAGYVVRLFTYPKAVIHPSTNRARCRATALPLHQTATNFNGHNKFTAYKNRVLAYLDCLYSSSASDSVTY